MLIFQVFLGMGLFYALFWLLKKMRKTKPKIAREPALGDIEALESLAQERDPLFENYEEEEEAPVQSENAFFEEESDDFDEAFLEEKKPEARPETSLCAIYLMADENKPYTGFALLQAILSADLRFGEMDIFHRFTDLNASSEILFSVASATEPGFFDINHIARYTCQGLCFFTQLSEKEDNFYLISSMIQTAKQIQAELGGQLLDGRKMPFDEKNLLESFS